MIDLDSFGHFQSFVAATLMLAILGAVAFVVMLVLPPRSWRLRSWLVAAVLLQGLMIFRAPIHLGLVDSKPVEITAVAAPGLELSGIEITGEPIRPIRTVVDPPQSTTPQSIDRPELQQSIWQVDLIQALFAVWLVVALGAVCVSSARYLRVLRLVRRLPTAPAQWQREWDSLSRSTESGRTKPAGGPHCRLLLSDSVGPLVIRRLSGYSMIVPRDYWNDLTTAQRRGIMLHELAHIQRADVWRQTAARLIATIHWFNPLAWWALRQYEHASECACDARVAGAGRRTAAGFASALIQLIQWHDGRPGSALPIKVRGIGFQSMAAPPIKERVSRLLSPHSQGDSIMKRIAIGLLAITLVGISFFQIRLTRAQESSRDGNRSAQTVLQVIDNHVAEQLADIAARLDLTDEATKRFRALLETSSGKIAVAGYLNELGDRSRREAQNEAIPQFVDKHFQRTDTGALVVRRDSQARLDMWTRKSRRLSEDMQQMQAAMSDIAGRLDTSSEAGGLFKRLLQDPQASIAVLINELQGRGTIERFLDATFEDILVDQGDGTHIVVESKRDEVARQIDRFEHAGEISHRLKRELPIIAAEYAPKDDSHRELIDYLRHPLTAAVVATEVSDDTPSVRSAIENVHQHFEENSMDTVDGLVIVNNEAWESMKEIFSRVDRAENLTSRVGEKLAEFADALSIEDELTARLAAQMKNETMAVYLSSEIPYADANAGEELRGLLSEVMTESDNKLMIQGSRQDELTYKSRELLQMCRRIRRHAAEIDDVLDQIADRSWVDGLGEAGRYAMLDEIRRFAESHRPDVLLLLEQELLAENATGRIRVREDRRDVVRELIEQSERVRAEEANNDF